MPGLTEQDLNNIFTYHPPEGDQTARYEQIRGAALTFAKEILVNTPACADQTVAIRKVREAVMIANAAIAITESERK